MVVPPWFASRVRACWTPSDPQGVAPAGWAGGMGGRDRDGTSRDSAGGRGGRAARTLLLPPPVPCYARKEGPRRVGRLIDGRLLEREREGEGTRPQVDLAGPLLPQ